LDALYLEDDWSKPIGAAVYGDAFFLEPGEVPAEAEDVHHLGYIIPGPGAETLRHPPRLIDDELLKPSQARVGPPLIGDSLKTSSGLDLFKTVIFTLYLSAISTR